jgi:hypothetical protein
MQEVDYLEGRETGTLLDVHVVASWLQSREKIDDPIFYQGRPAWAIYYRGPDCKLQVAWSARDGGIDYFLAPPDAPNEFGLLNESKKWRLMLLLSNVRDELVTPGLDADDEAEVSWLKALFEIHYRRGPCSALK